MVAWGLVFTTTPPYGRIRQRLLDALDTFKSDTDKMRIEVRRRAINYYQSGGGHWYTDDNLPYYSYSYYHYYYYYY